MVKINSLGPDFNKYITLLLIMLTLPFLVGILTVVDVGPGITHDNDLDTITTPLPGNCPNCDYPDCGGCDGKPQITLMPTTVIPTIEDFGGTVVMPATPEIPHPTPCGVSCATVFPTFQINGQLPTPLSTFPIPTIAPTLVAPDYPPSPIPVPG